MALISVLICTILFLIVLISLRRNLIKKKWCRVGGYISLGVLGWFSIGQILLFLVSGFSVTKACLNRHICGNNLEQLRTAIVLYCNENNGKFPTPEKWCDLLKHADPQLRLNNFRCPEDPKHDCGYSFNENLRGAVLSSVSEDTILVFEGGGKWNSTGGSEMVNLRHDGGDGKKGMGFVLQVKGPRLIYVNMTENVNTEKNWKPLPNQTHIQN